MSGSPLCVLDSQFQGTEFRPPLQLLFIHHLTLIVYKKNAFQREVCFVEGRVSPNFNSAALLLQGSSNIYGKKVEFLYNLTSKLCECLLKNKQDAPGKDNHKKIIHQKKKSTLKKIYLMM
ncbi:hypothetical protein CEXT_718131 [Caerostris extrusa]|uniref:Condensin II complex subunit H2 N-terminal domain-containing protein n=1 Tax=Caerostris extrusa TaxID=172846 RepID=A0AAV4WRS2_CAEEX|nr:hypothetical protein CEXT_718131 [Caerostris extrusa]